MHLYPVFQGNLRGLFRTGFLGLHGLVKASLVQGIATFTQDQGREVNRKAEGVVEFKGLGPVHFLSGGLPNDLFQEGKALFQGLQEGDFLFPHHVFDELLLFL